MFSVFEGSKTMRAQARWVSGTTAALAVLLVMTIGMHVVHGRAEHVRWDIISVQFNTPSPGVNTIRPDGVAFALASNPNTLRIRLTGFGTFVAPASGGPSSAVTGGGTWETSSGTTSTGSGTYWVTRLASWEFANFQAPVNVDNIGPNAANGNAVLRIQYSDGSEGTLGIGCHGPGAPDGIVEGVIATKDFVTYWNAEPPLPLVDANRTAFHVN
jgi:hypothetical protein